MDNYNVQEKKVSSPKDIYLLFDAGGTLLFPNQTLMIELAKHAGIKLTASELYRGYYSLIYQLDSRASDDGKFPDKPWPEGYAYSLFQCMGKRSLDMLKLAQEIEKSHKQQNLWTFTFHWVRETLGKLREAGYKMSVLSNSDGRTGEIISKLNLDDYFDEIYDSHKMGVSKPDSAIFIKTLKDRKLEPEQVLYVGDLYEVDVRGANSAGIGAIHIDPFRKYQDSRWPGIHIETVRDLPEWLDEYRYGNIDVNLLYPCSPPLREHNNVLMRDRNIGYFTSQSPVLERAAYWGAIVGRIA